jgi:hypothetical protein
MSFMNKIIGMKLIRSIIFAFLLLPLAFVSAEAHTFHTSLTRMDFDAKEKNIEISIQLFVHDVAPMLERRLKKPIDLEKTPEVESEIFKYLGENFVFQNKKGEPQKLKWLGKEFETDTLYVYLEIQTDEGFDGAKLSNTIFFDSFPEQTNLVIAHLGEKKSDLIFKSGDKFKEL